MTPVMDRYHITVDLEVDNQRGLSKPRNAAIATRLRDFWPLAVVINDYGNPLPQANVVAEFDGPVHAMDVLGAVIATFGESGAPATFRSVRITAMHHDKPVTVADLERG
jgi:hypothetical protein